MIKEPLAQLKHEKEAYKRWKNTQVTPQEYKDAVQEACKNGIG